MSEKMTLYHGTSLERMEKVLSGKEQLIGQRNLVVPGWSGTLTDDKKFATSWAHKRGINPIVLTYDLPTQILIQEGRLSYYARQFVTNLEVSLEQLPTLYLQALLYFNLLDMELLKMQVEKGKTSFHAVPFEYLVNHENV